MKKFLFVIPFVLSSNCFGMGDEISERYSDAYDDIDYTFGKMFTKYRLHEDYRKEKKHLQYLKKQEYSDLYDGILSYIIAIMKGNVNASGERKIKEDFRSFINNKKLLQGVLY